MAFTLRVRWIVGHWIAEKIDIWSLDSIPPIPDMIGGDKIVADCAGFDVSYWDFSFLA